MISLDSWRKNHHIQPIVNGSMAAHSGSNNNHHDDIGSHGLVHTIQQMFGPLYSSTMMHLNGRGIVKYPRVTTRDIEPTRVRQYLNAQTLADVLLYPNGSSDSSTNSVRFATPRLAVAELHVGVLRALNDTIYDLRLLDPSRLADSISPIQTKNLVGKPNSIVVVPEDYFNALTIPWTYVGCGLSLVQHMGLEPQPILTNFGCCDVIGANNLWRLDELRIGIIQDLRFRNTLLQYHAEELQFVLNAIENEEEITFPDMTTTTIPVDIPMLDIRVCAMINEVVVTTENSETVRENQRHFWNLASFHCMFDTSTSRSEMPIDLEINQTIAYDTELQLIPPPETCSSSYLIHGIKDLSSIETELDDGHLEYMSHFLPVDISVDPQIINSPMQIIFPYNDTTSSLALPITLPQPLISIVPDQLTQIIPCEYSHIFRPLSGSFNDTSGDELPKPVYITDRYDFSSHTLQTSFCNVIPLRDVSEGMENLEESSPIRIGVKVRPSREYIGLLQRFVTHLQSDASEALDSHFTSIVNQRQSMINTPNSLIDGMRGSYSLILDMDAQIVKRL